MAFPVVDTEYLKEIEKARRDLRALIAFKNCAPIMLLLAWHDAGTYDVNWWIKCGLKIAIDFCEEVKAKHPKITCADLCQGRAHPERSGFDGPWTNEPLKELLKGESAEFRLYVELYAKDEEPFFRDYAVSHKKLSELGFNPSSSRYLYEVRKRMKWL
ncbi:ascorbate peroxidase 3 [Hibiscus trionum]|uniref:Ascorbate peroxidase 3 n=1 Tax=Hibiscus trionum TaxID=183268 RepID=A0A9W7I2E2_HIBTR|nr:ascorbate peroxidase 3 [Hibiscus trionum]